MNEPIAASAESRVRAVFAYVAFYPLMGGGGYVRIGPDLKQFRSDNLEALWSTVLDFANERQEQARQIEEEIACLEGLLRGLTDATPVGANNPPILAAFRRIIIAEQERLATATRGMKERK